MLARQRWSRAALATVAIPVSAVVGAGLLLHGVLTYRTIGTFRLSAAAGGLNFVEGKCPSKRNIDSTGAAWLFADLRSARDDLVQAVGPAVHGFGLLHERGAEVHRPRSVRPLQSFESIPFLFVGNFLWPATNSSGAPLARLVRTGDRTIPDGRRGAVAPGAMAVATQRRGASSSSGGCRSPRCACASTSSRARSGSACRSTSGSSRWPISGWMSRLSPSSTQDE